MAILQGIGALNAFNVRNVQQYGKGELPKVARQSFVQSSIAPNYSLSFPKVDNSVPAGDSPLGQKLPRLYA